MGSSRPLFVPPLAVLFKSPILLPCPCPLMDMVYLWFPSRLCINLVVAYHPFQSSESAKFCVTSVSEWPAMVGGPRCAVAQPQKGKLPPLQLKPHLLIVKSAVLAAISLRLTQCVGISLKHKTFAKRVPFEIASCESKQGSISDRGNTNRPRRRRLSLPKVSDSRSKLPGHSAQCFGAEPHLEAIS
jgi:hypothetical protein